MNWFGRLINRLTGEARPTTSRIVASPRTSAGVWVDGDTALKNATVWACVQFLTGSFGQLPWRVMKAVSAGGEVQGKNPVDYLIHQRPNPDMGAFTWRQTMLGRALLRGNAYAEIERDGRGLPFALWPIHPDRVRPQRNRRGDLEYEVWNQSGNVLVAAADMYHVKGFGDGDVGLDVISYAAESIGWAQATEVFGSTYFGNGMNPSGIVTVENELAPEGLIELRKDLERLYKGPKGQRTAILDAGMKWQSVGIAPNDGQFIETRQHQVEEICRWFGVPPHKVMHLLRATFSNIEHQSIEVVVDSVTPWAKRFEEEADFKLFGPQNRQGFYTKVFMQALLRGDNASRLAFYKGMFEIGALTINEIRALEDINGIGADGDQHFVSNNVQTLERAIAGPPAAVVAPPATPPADDQADDTETPPAEPDEGAQ